MMAELEHHNNSLLASPHEPEIGNTSKQSAKKHVSRMGIKVKKEIGHEAV
jgi:hypothetical protein